MITPSIDVVKILEHVNGELGAPTEWAKWPGGWPGDIEAALVDAVFSGQAVYRSKRGRGVHANVVSWRDARQRNSFTLEILLAEIDEAGPRKWAQQFGNEQWSPGRPVSAPGGASKAATVRQAACLLTRKEGVRVDTQISVENAANVKAALRQVPGIGYATANYFFMLLGSPGVKPDRMIHRFLKNGTGHWFTNAAAEQTITAAARQLDVQPHELEHAIWRYESNRAAAV